MTIFVPNRFPDAGLAPHRYWSVLLVDPAWDTTQPVPTAQPSNPTYHGPGGRGVRRNPRRGDDHRGDRVSVRRRRCVSAEGLQAGVQRLRWRGLGTSWARTTITNARIGLDFGAVQPG
jgi:hypothetical protein